jgi:putative ABC transport system substrate-binding protein
MVLNKQIKNRRQILLVVCFITAFAFLSGCGEKAQEEKVYRVGIVSGVNIMFDIADGFKAKMTELGYVEGENIVYDLHTLNADPAGERRVVRKFVEDKVDLIVSFPTEPTIAAKAATQGTGIPVIFVMAAIEGSNLVESVSKPGGNITGSRFPGPENTVKRLEILHELVPQARRIYIIYDPNYPTVPHALEQLRPAASSWGLTLVEDQVNNPDEFKTALQKRAALDDIGVDAILIMPEVLSQTPEGFEALLTFANEHTLPLGGTFVGTVYAGAIFSYSTPNAELGVLVAPLADKILKGTPAGTIPVVTPEASLRLNYKVMQKLGLEVSEGLMSQAVEIVR